MKEERFSSGTPSKNKISNFGAISPYPEYDTKSDGEVPVMLEVWGMQSNPLLPSLLSSLRSGVVAPDRVQSMC